MPVDRSFMSLRKASSSFHDRGVVTVFHALSSNDTVSAPRGSPTNSLQSELKLYVVRAAMQTAEMKIRISTNELLMISVAERFRVCYSRARRDRERTEL